MSWEQIRAELQRRRDAGESVETLVFRVRNWIDEVGNDYVVVRSERTERPRTITRHSVESSPHPNRITVAIRQLGDCSHG